MKMQKSNKQAFTLIEILVVLVILAIAAFIAIPMMSSAADIQVCAAADMIAADLEYTKSMAVSRQKAYKIVFDTVGESYRIEDESGVIMHPVNLGKIYEMNFKTDSRVSDVDISAVNFAGAGQVEFNYLGAPSSAGSITVVAGGKTIIVSVEAATGYVSVSD